MTHSVRLLLGSGGYRTPERVQFLAQHMQSFFGSIRRLLFIPYALADHERYRQSMLERGINAGYELVGIHQHSDPLAALHAAEGIFVGGGNTFRLLDAMIRFKLLEALRALVRSGMPYLGISAGTNLACPTIQTTNDMPIVQPHSCNALGLIPFQVNAHYYHGSTYLRAEDEYVPHFGETRDERLREFHEMNDTPVVGLWEMGILRREGANLRLLGTPARLFRKNEAPCDVAAGTDLSYLLSSE